MNRQRTLQRINQHLEQLDGKALEGLLTMLDNISPSVSASGLPYTGDPETDEVLDDPEMTRRALEWKATFAGLTPQEQAAKRQEMLERGELIPL